MPAGNVQHFLVTDFGLSEDSTTITLDHSVSLANSFAMITGFQFHSGGPTAGDGAVR